MKANITTKRLNVNFENNELKTNISNVQRIAIGATDYDQLENKPQINDITLIGNKSLDDLNIVEKENGKGLSSNDYTNTEKTKLQGIQEGANVNTIESISVNGTEQTIDDNKNIELTIPYNTSDLINNDNTVKDASYVHTDNNFTSGYKIDIDNNTVARHVHNNKVILDNIKATDISNWNNKADKNEIPDVSNFITKDVKNLTNYELKTNTGSLINLSIDNKTYIVTLELKNSNGTVISTGNIDLPLETVVVGGRYDSSTKKVILTLENGNTVEFSVADLVAGLQSEITSTNKLTSDLVDDSNSGNKFVTINEKEIWNNKGTYSKPVDGIPETDLSNTVQSSLGKADTALQEHQDISGKVDKIAGKGLSTNDYTTEEKNKLSGIETGATANKEYYGTSSTKASTRDKVVVCEGFVLENGAHIRVLFSQAQTYNGTPTLNVNSTGAIAIQIKSGTNAVRYVWSAGEIIDFTYNGTHWIMHRSAVATTTYYGLAKLATSAISTNTATALTPASLNSVMEHIVTGYPVYSASLTYEVGDRVRYSFYVYECITAITTAEAWTAEHWQIVDPLQTQIDDLKRRLDALENK